jgi:hypothetical protein
MIYFSKQTRIQLTMALFVLLAGACSAAQQKTVRDVLEGVQATCKGADPLIELVLEKTPADAGAPIDSSSQKD